jgi:hypothetical protein
MTTSAGGSLPALLPALHLPLYYITFHGAYDIDPFSAPPSFVPPNCFLLETCVPGEVVNELIDDYLWPTCNYTCREQFLATLSMHSSEPSQTPYQAAIRTLHTTLPGAIYVPRTITAEKGRGARNFFQGIYKFTNKTPFTDTPPRGASHTLYKGNVKNLIEDYGSYTTTDSIIRQIRENDPDARESDGAIFVFVTCATNQLGRTSRELLEKIWYENHLSFMEKHDGLSRISMDFERSEEDETVEKMFVELYGTWLKRISKPLKREIAALRW